jgi:ABC-type transporter lipoprotein component MlaA
MESPIKIVTWPFAAIGRAAIKWIDNLGAAAIMIAAHSGSAIDPYYALRYAYVQNQGRLIKRGGTRPGQEGPVTVNPKKGDVIKK